MPKRQLPIQADLIINRLRWEAMVDRQLDAFDAAEKVFLSFASLNATSRDSECFLAMSYQPKHAAFLDFGVLCFSCF